MFDIHNRPKQEMHEVAYGFMKFMSCLTSRQHIFFILSRVSTLTRGIDIAILSVRLSVTLRYQMKTA